MKKSWLVKKLNKQQYVSSLGHFKWYTKINILQNDFYFYYT